MFIKLESGHIFNTDHIVRIIPNEDGSFRVDCLPTSGAGITEADYRKLEKALVTEPKPLPMSREEREALPFATISLPQEEDGKQIRAKAMPDLQQAFMLGLRPPGYEWVPRGWVVSFDIINESQIWVVTILDEKANRISRVGDSPEEALDKALEATKEIEEE